MSAGGRCMICNDGPCEGGSADDGCNEAMDLARAELRRAGYPTKPEPHASGTAIHEDGPRLAEGTNEHQRDSATLRRMLDEALEREQAEAPLGGDGCGAEGARGRGGGIVIGFHVRGVPVGKGSMRVFQYKTKDGKQRACIGHDNKKTYSWSATVAAEAKRAMVNASRYAKTPLVLQVMFLLPRPASHYGKRGLKASAPAYPMTKPDLDKLVRVIGDSLEGIVYDNDSRIVSQTSSKEYATDERTEGVIVTVRAIGEQVVLR